MVRLAPAVVLTTGHSHLFPGSRLVADQTFLLDGSRDVLVSFGDGSAAVGSLRPDGGEAAELEVEAYTTAAGTAVGDRWWHTLLTRDDATGGLTSVVVKRRLVRVD